MERIFFAVLSIPLLFICLVSSIQMLLVHVPYLTFNCGSAHCAAGSVEQFVIWTLLMILLVAYLLISFCFQGPAVSNHDGQSKSPDRPKLPKSSTTVIEAQPSTPHENRPIPRLPTRLHENRTRHDTHCHENNKMRCSPILASSHHQHHLPYEA